MAEWPRSDPESYWKIVGDGPRARREGQGAGMFRGWTFEFERDGETRSLKAGVVGITGGASLDETTTAVQHYLDELADDDEPAERLIVSGCTAYPGQAMADERGPNFPEVFPTYFHADGREWGFQEQSFLPLNRGDGLLDNEGNSYRVVDKYVSYNHHGFYAEGLHLFLERIEPGSDDDTLSKAHPEQR